MSGINLKHYDTYLERIELYAQAIGIKIEYRKDLDGDGSYVPTRSKIKIDSELSQSAEIGTLLHELGHEMDEDLVNEKTSPKLERAYRSVYGGKGSKRQKAMVVRCEKRAWEYGKIIAKKLNIRLGKWYEVEQEDALDSYRKQ